VNKHVVSLPSLHARTFILRDLFDPPFVLFRTIDTRRILMHENYTALREIAHHILSHINSKFLSLLGRPLRTRSFFFFNFRKRTCRRVGSFYPHFSTFEKYARLLLISRLDNLLRYGHCRYNESPLLVLLALLYSNGENGKEGKNKGKERRSLFQLEIV